MAAALPLGLTQVMGELRGGRGLSGKKVCCGNAAWSSGRSADHVTRRGGSKNQWARGGVSVKRAKCQLDLTALPQLLGKFGRRSLRVATGPVGVKQAISRDCDCA
jgi:hypothetical protein